MESQKLEIKRRLGELTETNKRLRLAVTETRVASVTVMNKLRKEFVTAHRSLSGICKKLKEGAILLNFKGEVVQLNEAAEKLFGVDEASALQASFSKIITEMNPILLDGRALDLTETFFSDLSCRILNKLQCTKCDGCSREQRIKSQLPSFFDMENDAVTEVQLTRNGKQLMTNFTFSILDNEPQTLNDLTYVFLFTSAKRSRDQLARAH